MPEASAPTDDEPAAEAELRRRLSDCPATRALANGNLRPLDGGLSNRAWRLDAAGRTWFARLGHPGAAALGVDRASECMLLRAVAAAGLSPEVLACEPAADLLVTGFVGGAPWQAADVPIEANLRRVAGLLRRLHALPVPAGVQSVSYSQQARRLAEGLPTAAADADLHDRAERIFARLDGRGFTPALCHHDLHHLNLIDDGRAALAGGLGIRWPGRPADGPRGVPRLARTRPGTDRSLPQGLRRTVAHRPDPGRGGALGHSTTCSGSGTEGASRTAAPPAASGRSVCRDACCTAIIP